MVFSERASLTLSKGIRFRTDSLRSVAVYDQCTSWGLWSPMRPNNDRAPAGIAALGRCHLIVSPFHPASWPYLLRIQVKLADELNVLATVAQGLANLPADRLFTSKGQSSAVQGHFGNKPPKASAIKKLLGNEFLNAHGVSDHNLNKSCQLHDVKGINILHQDQAPTGFGHSTWTAVIEVLAARRIFDEIKQRIDAAYVPPRFGKAPNSPEDSERDCKQLYTAIQKVMQECENGLRGYFNGLLKEEPPLLRHYHGKQSICGTLKPRPFVVRRLEELPYHANFGGGGGAPFPMTYLRAQRLLSFVSAIDHPDADGIDKVLPPEVPHLSVASFDPAEYIVRVVPIPEAMRKERSILVKVDYDIRAKNATIPGMSRGLVGQVANIIGKEGFSILSILDKSYEISHKGERGDLRIIALKSEPIEDHKATHARVESAVRGLSQKWDTIDTQGIQSLSDSATQRPQGEQQQTKPGLLGRKRYMDASISARCVVPSVHRLFISMNLTHKRRRNLMELLKSACSRLGFEPITVETYLNKATPTVLNEIRHCDAFLQILVEGGPKEKAKRSWLDFEYGVASGAEKPRVRLVDVSTKTYEEWATIVDIDRDQYSKPIDLSLSNSHVRIGFSDALSNLAQELSDS